MSADEVRESIKNRVEEETVTRESLEDTVPFLQYATNDVDIIEQVKADPDLIPFLPLYSQLLRLTKVNDKEKMHFQHRITRIFNISKIFTDDEDYDAGKWGKLQAHEAFLKMVPNDSHKGFKMERLTKQDKNITFGDPNKKEKKGFW